MQFEKNLSYLNPAKVFKYIKSVTSSSSVPPLLSLDTATASIDKEKVTLFNSYFHSVFTRNSCLIPPVEDLSMCSFTLSDISLFKMDVFEALSSLDTSKACGADGISPKILKHCVVALYQLIHHLFMLSLSQYYLPVEWRFHLIIPAYKAGDKSSDRNYRPISLLRVILKVLEKFIYDKIYPFVSKFISPFQCSFRPKHSSTQQLLTFLHSLQVSLCSSSQVDVVYLHFKKAFDSVPHNKLLVKLWSSGNLWKWF